MRARNASLFLAYVILTATACGGSTGGGGGSLTQATPVAMRPTLQEVRTSKGIETAVKVTYDLLPTTNFVRVRFSVPTFTELDVYQDATLLTRVSYSPGATIPPGSYQGDVITNTSTTADWGVLIPVANLGNPNKVWIGIRNRSINPDLIGGERVSDPLELCVADFNITGCGPKPALPAPPNPPSGAVFTTGVDCMCSKTGAYVAPASPVLPSLKNATGVGGNSPNDVYKVLATIVGGSTTLEVTHMQSNALVHQETITGTNLQYGFSPVDARFAYSFTTAGNRVARLFDLSTGAALKRFDKTSSAAQVFAGFSPSGKYFIHAQSPGGTASVDIYDAASGSTVYQTSTFSFASPAAAMGTPFPPVVGGFSPDAGDRTFVYWYWASSGNAQWTMVNLATAKSVLSTTLAGVSLGRFSPCGDVLALIRQASGSSEVTSYRTRNGSSRGPAETFASTAAPSLQCSTVEHTVTIGGVTRSLGVNGADAPIC
jgi:hypothetical protein